MKATEAKLLSFRQKSAQFADVNEPKRLCEDVTNLGRRGNGDVEGGLELLDELSYVMGLVRQSHGRQMRDRGQT